MRCQPRDIQSHAPKKGRYLEYLSWKEAEAALKETPLVLLPLGARLKEHGPHLPLNNDWIMAEYLTKRVLDEVAVLALPTVQYGYYPAFVEYPGSINIGRDTFRDFMADICRSVCRFGPKKVYVLNTGISTNKALEPARQLLAKEGIVMEYTLLTEATAEAEKKVKQEPEGTHADEIETSMMLYMAPEIVRMKLAVRDIHPNHPGPLTRDEHATQGVYSPSGVWGDATLATREKGKIITEALVAHLRQADHRSSPTRWMRWPRRRDPSFSEHLPVTLAGDDYGSFSRWIRSSPGDQLRNEPCTRGNPTLTYWPCRAPITKLFSSRSWQCPMTT